MTYLIFFFALFNLLYYYFFVWFCLCMCGLKKYMTLIKKITQSKIYSIFPLSMLNTNDKKII